MTESNIGTNAEKITIRNVALLDLRTANEETLRSIGRIENAAAVLYSPQTAASVARISAQNVAAMLEAPADAQLVTGQTTWGKRFFDDIDTPLSVIAVGQIMLESDIQPEDVRAGLDKLIVVGQLLYPDHLGGVIQGKIEHLSGQTLAYDADSRLTIGRLKLTQSYLTSLKDGAKQTVIGSVNARAVLPNELIERKLGDLRIVGALTCREENADALLSRMQGGAADVRVTVIPAGFEPVSGSVTIDAAMLEALPARKLYGSDLHIASDVEAAALDEAVDALHVSHLLIAPAALRSVLARKVNLLETDAVLYAGALWHVDDEETLVAERFDFVDGPVTLVVTGELTIAPDVDAKLLAERIDKVHNFGEILCTPAEMAALQARKGLGHGEFVTGDTGDAGDNVIGNTAYLKL